MNRPPNDPRRAAQLEIWQNRFAGVCDEMGAALRRAAYSPNVKEREDFSCAIFSPTRELVGQAEHIPVHLGSMAASVEAALAAFGELGEGDQVVLNDPFRGGTHLNDITFVCAAHNDEGKLLGYVANRAHHADIGGCVPGSLSATAVDSIAEGLCLPPIRAVRAGAWDEDVRAILLANTRTPLERAGDLDAQWGANRLGARRFTELGKAHGHAGLHTAMHEAIDYGERRMRTELGKTALRASGPLQARDTLEDSKGAVVHLQVAIEIDENGLRADFAGTEPARPGVPSAVQAVTRACLEFATRSALPSDVPRNGGVSRLLHLSTPRGSVVDAQAPMPVGVGNVEASQRIADLLLAALAPLFPDRIGAASQGTMNNLLIGSLPGATRPFVYYETMGGGQGGRPGKPGQNGIHTGMTNTANTPIEALESEFPLFVQSYRLRQNSGGRGAQPGGEGLERVVRLEQDAQVTLLAGRRGSGAPGQAGGGAGEPGEDFVHHPDGHREALAPLSSGPFVTGTTITVRTPGGGGRGRRKESP